VYRNIDALYDVLLRVSAAADLAATPDEAASVDASLQQLQVARAQLGDAILKASQHREAQIVSLSAARPPAAQPAAKTSTVIDDGPESTQAKKAKKKKPTPPPSNADTSN
jgi:hypothetical protein